MFWYCQLVVILLAPIVVSTVVVRRIFKDADTRVGVGFIGGAVLLFVTMAAVFTFTNSYSIRIIRVEDGAKYETVRVFGYKNLKCFKNMFSGELTPGSTYIENLSTKDIVIEPVTYVRFQPINSHLFSSFPKDEDECQKIQSGSVSLCEHLPDYYFETPDKVSVKVKKGNYKQVEVEKWILRYDGPCMP